MATLTNKSPVQMPGTSAPTPPVVSYTIAATRAQPVPGGGFQILYTIQAKAADGSVVNPPQGWQVPAAVATALQAAVAAALDAVGPVQLKPVLVTVGGYTG